MRIFLVVAIVFGALDVTARADDSSPVAGKLPDNDRSQQTYLFMLKKNGISLRIPPDQFCRDLGYGAAVARSDDSTRRMGYWEVGPTELKEDGATTKDHAAVTKDVETTKRPGELIWVICQAPKENAKPTPTPGRQ
jgi:hypothetical protein